MVGILREYKELIVKLKEEKIEDSLDAYDG